LETKDSYPDIDSFSKAVERQLTLTEHYFDNIGKNVSNMLSSAYSLGSLPIMQSLED